MRNVFIIGSKGIPANYGGFETFVDELVSRQKNEDIQYHVSCLSNDTKEFQYKKAHCFNINVPNIGPAKAVYYDIAALKYCVHYIKSNELKNSIVYILACRIGPFVGKYVNQLHSMNCKVYVNPDGHEWKRAKWNYFIRKYWKLSEKLMVKHADLLICDSKNIEKYIQNDYKQYNPSTTFIAYGADTSKSTLKDNDEKILNWYKEKHVNSKEYYLVVGRFVPENNYETMIKEFMKSNTKKDFVLITNVEENKFYDSLKQETQFDKDSRIKFVGTVYDQQLLKKIRENAYGYLHGHEVGGTNPSLLEALATTDLNLLLDVGFNKEVGEDGAVYWNKSNGDLANLINELEIINRDELKNLSNKAKKRIEDNYSWDLIIRKYEEVFSSLREEKEISLLETQRISLKIMNEIHMICQLNNYKYTLMYGTLIGAIRHSGYIPWDDDVDIMMPRDDYEKLVSFFIKNEKELYPLKLYEPRINDEYPYMIARISDERYRIETENENDCGMGVFIDIYPFDGLGNNYKDVLNHSKKIDHISSLCFRATRLKPIIKDTFTFKRKSIETFMFLYAKLRGKNYFVKKLNMLSKYYEFNNSDYVGCGVWLSGFEKDIYKKELFNELILHKFEKYEFFIPKQYDDVLKITYGNYMNLPPIEERAPHHFYKVYEKEVEYENN